MDWWWTERSGAAAKRAIGPLTLSFAAVSCSGATQTSTSPSSNPSVSASAPASAVAPADLPPCEIAAKDRGRAPGLLLAGRLDRTLRVIAHADRLCPERTHDSDGTRLEALIQIGDAEGAADLASHLASDSTASAEVRDAARALVDHPPAKETRSAREIVALAQKNDSAIEAQKLRDRGLFRAQRETHAEVRIEEPLSSSALPSNFAWSVDGHYLAMITGTGVSILDARNRLDEAWRLEGPTRQITDIAFSPKGKVLAAATEGNEVWIWDYTSGVEVHRLVHRPADPAMTPVQEYLTSIAYTHDGKYLVSVGTAPTGGARRVWDPERGVELDARARPGEVAVADDDLEVGPSEAWSKRSREAWERAVNAQPQSLSKSETRAHNPLLAPDGAVVVSQVDRDDDPVAIEVASGHVLRLARPRLPVEQPSRIAISPTLPQMATVTPHGGLLLWSAAGSALLGSKDDDTVTRFPRFKTTDPPLAFSPDGRWLASCDQESSADGVILWDAQTSKTVSGPRVPVCRQVAFSPNGKVIAAGGADKIQILRTGDESPPVTLDWPGAADFRSLEFSPDGKMLAASTASASQVYDTSTSQLKWSFDAVNLSFIPGDSSRAASYRIAGSGRDGIKLFDARTGNPLGGVAVPDFDSPGVFSRDGSWALEWTGEKVHLSELTGGKTATFDDWVRDAAFLPLARSARTHSDQSPLFATVGNGVLFRDRGGVLRASAQTLGSEKTLGQATAAYVLTFGSQQWLELLGNDTPARLALRCRVGRYSFPLRVCLEHFQPDTVESRRLFSRVLAGEDLTIDP